MDTEKLVQDLHQATKASHEIKSESAAKLLDAARSLVAKLESPKDVVLPICKAVCHSNTAPSIKDSEDTNSL